MRIWVLLSVVASKNRRLKVALLLVEKLFEFVDDRAPAGIPVASQASSFQQLPVCWRGLSCLRQRMPRSAA